MGDKSPHSASSNKQAARTLKEKRAAKKAKHNSNTNTDVTASTRKG